MKIYEYKHKETGECRASAYMNLSASEWEFVREMNMPDYEPCIVVCKEDFEGRGYKVPETADIDHMLSRVTKFMQNDSVMESFWECVDYVAGELGFEKEEVEDEDEWE